jgi:exosortase/archaeosortase family protein
MSFFFKYILKVALFYTAGFLIYHLLFALSDPKGQLNYPEYLKFLDVFRWMSILLIYPTIWILKLIGIKALAYPGIIWAPKILILVIKIPCLAVKYMITWMSLIIPYPFKKNKLLFFVFGLLFIHFLNILRMVGIIYGASIHQSWAEITHDLLNYFIYGCLFLCFLWISKNHKN